MKPNRPRALFILYVIRPVFFSDKARACYCRLTQFGFLFDSPEAFASKLEAKGVRQVRAEYAKSGYEVITRRVGSLVNGEFVPVAKAAA